MQVTAIHSITRAKNATPPHATPGAVFVSEGDELKHLIVARAVREATERDVQSAKANKVFFGESAKVEPAPAEPDSSGRDAIEARAKELGVTFRKNTNDDKLAELIAEAEAEAAASLPTDPDTQKPLV